MLSAKWRQFSLGLNVLRRSSLGLSTLQTQVSNWHTENVTNYIVVDYK